MACRLFGAKSLSKPLLDYCKLNPEEQTSIKFWSKYRKYRLRNGGHVGGRWVFPPKDCSLQINIGFDIDLVPNGSPVTYWYQNLKMCRLLKIGLYLFLTFKTQTPAYFNLLCLSAFFVKEISLCPVQSPTRRTGVCRTEKANPKLLMLWFVLSTGHQQGHYIISSLDLPVPLIILRTRQNDNHFAGDLFFFMNERCCILILILVIFLHGGPIHNIVKPVILVAP